MNAPPSGPDERDIAVHIFGNSAMMVGLCLTIISIMKAQKSDGQINTVVDDLIAADALLFMLSCFLSYSALRVRHQRRMHQVETLADVVFLVGLATMGIACALFVWTIW